MNLYGEVLENVSLKDYNTYKIGGKTRYLVKPYNIDSLKELLIYINNNNLKYIIIGNGSNIILPDSDYDGVIILLSKLNEIKINENTVNAFCGVSLTYFVNELVKNNLGGLESLSGIPGTLGGAIVNNAGCYGQTISDKLNSVTYLENGYYSIICINSNLSLDVEGNSKRNDANIIQYNDTGADNQQWIIKDAGNGYYNIIWK